MATDNPITRTQSNLFVSISGVWTHLQLFSEAEVYKLDISGAVEQQVLGLEVAVDDAAAVEVVEGLDDAAGVEPRGGVVKVAAVPEDGPELPAQAGLHQHVEILAVFECFEQLHDEMAVGLLHNFLFCNRNIN